MKNLFLSVIAILRLATAGCKKTNIKNLTSCQWKFVEIKDKKTAEITKAPQVFVFYNKPYLLEFKEDKTINFPVHCNIRTAAYSVKSKNIIKFQFGARTLLYCDILSDLEEVVLLNFEKSLTYSITKNSLVIDCEYNKLYFEKFEE